MAGLPSSFSVLAFGLATVFLFGVVQAIPASASTDGGIVVADQLTVHQNTPLGNISINTTAAAPSDRILSELFQALTGGASVDTSVNPNTNSTSAGAAFNPTSLMESLLALLTNSANRFQEARNTSLTSALDGTKSNIINLPFPLSAFAPVISLIIIFGQFFFTLFPVLFSFTFFGIKWGTLSALWAFNLFAAFALLAFLFPLWLFLSCLACVTGNAQCTTMAETIGGTCAVTFDGTITSCTSGCPFGSAECTAEFDSITNTAMTTIEEATELFIVELKSG